MAGVNVMVTTTAIWLVLSNTMTTTVSMKAKFHHLLSENDLDFYFGTRKGREVPQYEIVHILRSRHTRTAGIHPPQLHYRLKALGEEYHLHLERNQHLVAPGCLMTFTDGKDGVLVSPCPGTDQHCYYTGTSTMHNGSNVALRTCVGLHGVITTPTHQVLIQPVRGHHLAAVNTGRGVIAPHLVYHLTREGACGVQGTAEQMTPRRVRRQAGGLFLEMLLVADKTMHRYHGDDLVNYMLTAANVAAGRYLDSSLGVPIHVTVIRLMVLQEHTDGLNITSDADYTLNSFCQWQEKFNPHDDTDPRHVDAASLMTRENLVHKGVTETTGLASLGGICVKDMRCSVLEDNGLDIGLTLAHETGHSLNMQHDSEGNICDDKTNIMSTGGGGGAPAFKWSSCSRDALFNFLYEGKGACLLDSPSAVGIPLPKDLPGVIYPGDKQCELFLGQGSKICEGTSLVDDFGGDECSKLVCFDPNLPGQCSGSQAPRMDGTECGHRRWCIRGRCTDIGPDGPPPRDGGWSEWDAEWSVCSRTCGGGVRVKTRKCDRPRPLFGGKTCEGTDAKAKLCNVEPCSTSQYRYKEEQCAATDVYPVDGRRFHWLPGYTVGDSVCMLYCSPVGDETIHLRGVGMSTDYKDGTECDSDARGTYNRCVLGKCRAFGCDGVSDTTARLDICGICSGSNNTCEKKTGSFFRGEEKSYVTFLTIPRGSTGIKMTNDNRYTWMSIRVNGRRLFNTNGRQKDKKDAYSREGVKVLYAPYGPESIQIQGPVPMQLEAQVYRLFGYTYSDVNPEIYYEFYQPLSTPLQYTWTIQEGPCSTTCGHGSRPVEAVCVRVDGGARVAKSNCDEGSKPDTKPRVCQQPPCPPRWHTGEYGPCSRSCGQGLAYRTVQCLQYKAGQRQVLDDNQCNPDSRPVTSKSCGSQPCPTMWRTDPWADCSRTCGMGVRRRAVRCVMNTSPPTQVPDSYCEPSDEPSISETCQEATCSTSPEEDEGTQQWGDRSVYDQSAFQEESHMRGGEVTPEEDGERQKIRDVTTDAEGYLSSHPVTTDGVRDDITIAENDVQHRGSDISQGGEGDLTRRGVNGLAQRREDDVTQGEEVTGEESDDEGLPSEDDREDRISLTRGCMDVLSNCLQYSESDCRQFPDWARQNCQRRCNYCGETDIQTTTSTTSDDSDCSDVNTQCVEYPDSVCKEYEVWARINCRRRCHYCEQVIATATCMDASRDCRDYDHSVCVHYRDWAEVNCRKFCHICT
ncbi:A disintegrin and metalloproteinase with thrombospondin motifs 15-like [Haliotis asinina]|uniref:A disintegrin and metalloproteinase with thrombospondin motifs 15-like n=1 Tax=Haliotis asinina TaxID=109174 RepID=UPI0035320594